MTAIGKTIVLSFITAAAVLSLTAQAAPTVSSVSVSGYLKRQSGSVVSNGTYASSISLSSGGVALGGCSDVTDTVVSSGYFSKQIACPAVTVAAGNAGNITAGVSLTIGGTPESFTVTAYPVPTALVAGTALTVENDSINNLKISGTAAISLAKLNTAGATSGDVIRFDGANWAYTGLGSLNISTTNVNNNFTAPQNFSGGVNIGTATIGTSVVTNETVSGNSTVGGYQSVTGAGTFGSLAILNGVGITAGLAVGGSQTVGGYLGVTGAGTFGSLHVNGDTATTNLNATGYVSAAAGTIANAVLTGTVTAVNVSATGYASAAAGTIGNLNATNLTATGYATAAAGTIASLATTDVTAGGYVAATGAGTFGGGITVSNGAFGVTTGTGTINLSTANTGTMAIGIQATGANAAIRLSAATIAIAPTAKMVLGANGTALAGIGTCTFTAAVTTGQTYSACVGLPATTTVAIACSPTTVPSAGSGVIFRGSGTVGSIGLRGSAAVTSTAWNCLWVQP